MNAFPWPIFITLLAAGLFGSIAVLPYALALNPGTMDALKEKMATSKKPLPPMLIVVLSSVIQGGLLIAIAAYVGLLASRAVGLRMPVFDAIFSGQPFAGMLLAMLPLSLLVGVVGGALILVLDKYFFLSRVPAQFRQATAKGISSWKGMLACFYGGIAEEILMRLFVMAGLAWLIALVWKTPAGMPTVGAFWLANILSTVLFGLGHLPATARIAPLTPMLVIRAVVLNGLVGLACGFLFMAYGLEAAIIAHFTADIVIHVIAAK